MSNAVLQRAPRVAKCFQMLAGQAEFRLDSIDEAVILDTPWTIRFDAPSNSPYHPQEMHIAITFSPRFPFEPPAVRFISRVYHPNIDTTGTICLDLLKPLPAGSWKPSIDIVTLLTAVKLLLAEPNPDDPLMPDIATEYREDVGLYNRRAKQVALTGELENEASAEEDVIEATVVKRTLLKRKAPTSEDSKGPPILIAEKENMVQLNGDPLRQPTTKPTQAPVVISLLDDDDEFESRPAKKPSLLSSSKSSSTLKE